MPQDESTLSTNKHLCKWCGKNKRLPAASRCRPCQDKVNARQKELRLRNKQAGLCKCGRQPPRDGKVDCELCFAEMSVSANVTYRKRKLDGLCKCGAAPPAGYRTCGTCRKHDKNKHARRRRRILEHYGLKCACCGEDTYEFLEIDHVDGDGEGNNHRREVGPTYAPGFQTLCSNCNRAKFRYGECPHKRQRRQ